MDLKKLHVLIADDNVFKAGEIRKALERNGITGIDIVRDQEKVWDRIFETEAGQRRPDLIVTDMQYPLTAGSGVDAEAGFKLIERMRKEQIGIPVIICSEANYESVRGILGSVWYRQDGDLFFAFREVLGRLQREA